MTQVFVTKTKKPIDVHSYIYKGAWEYSHEECYSACHSTQVGDMGQVFILWVDGSTVNHYPPTNKELKQHVTFSLTQVQLLLKGRMAGLMWCYSMSLSSIH